MRKIMGETGEWNRLVRVVAEAGAKLLKREGDDLAKVVWVEGGATGSPY